MAKPNEPKTHFEQVPVEIVVKIAKLPPGEGRAKSVDESNKPAAKKSAALPALQGPALNPV